MDAQVLELQRKLIETQMALLQYQHREVLANIEKVSRSAQPAEATATGNRS